MTQPQRHRPASRPADSHEGNSRTLHSRIAESRAELSDQLCVARRAPGSAFRGRARGRRRAAASPPNKDAKAARDQARVSARQGQYINRNSITVAAYLDQWLEAHAVEVKPKTLQDYRHLINRHVRPYTGELRLQAMSPAHLTKLYRELATN